MVKIKDISEIYNDDKEKNMEIYIDNGSELLKTNWIHNVGDKVILTLENSNKNNKLICGVKETEIIKNIDTNDLFKIICKIKKIDYEKIIGELINRIKDSKIDDKDALIGIQKIWDDEYYNIIQEFDYLNIENSLLWSKEKAIEFFKDDYDNIESEIEYLWIETTNKEKEIINIAKEIGLKEIYVEIM